MVDDPIIVFDLVILYAYLGLDFSLYLGLVGMVSYSHHCVRMVTHCIYEIIIKYFEFFSNIK